MEVKALAIPEVKLIVPRKFGDHRGFFSETYSRRAFAEAGIDLEFVQDNHSLSAEKGTVRGLHFQAPPHAQDKLIRVVRGRILDVAVDIRRDSPTYLQHVSAELSDENWAQMFVPIGFAHGFVSLEPDTEVCYKVTDFYAPQCDAGLRWDDPALGIGWGVGAGSARVSDKDAQLPGVDDFVSPFVFEGVAS